MLTLNTVLEQMEKQGLASAAARAKREQRQQDYRNSQAYKNHQANKKAKQALADFYKSTPKKQLPDTFNPDTYYAGWSDMYNNQTGNWRGD